MPPTVRVSGVHHAAIFVENLDRAAAFYSDVLGLKVTDRECLAEPGIEMLFLSAGSLHHDLVLSRRLDGLLPSVEKRELFHVAFALPPEQSFAAFLSHVEQHDIPVVAGPMEHPMVIDGSGTRLAIYLRDPDGYVFEVTQDQ